MYNGLQPTYWDTETLCTTSDTSKIRIKTKMNKNAHCQEYITNQFDNQTIDTFLLSNNCLQAALTCKADFDWLID